MALNLALKYSHESEEANPNQKNNLPTDNSQIIPEDMGNDEIIPGDASELQEISETINEPQDDITDQEVLTDQIVPSSEAKEFPEDETAAILDESEQSLENLETVPKVEEVIESKESTDKETMSTDEAVPQTSSIDDSKSELQGEKEETNDLTQVQMVKRRKLTRELYIRRIQEINKE